MSEYFGRWRRVMNWNRKVDASAREAVVELGNCLIDELKVVWDSMFEVRGSGLLLNWGIV